MRSSQPDKLAAEALGLLAKIEARASGEPFHAEAPKTRACRQIARGFRTGAIHFVGDLGPIKHRAETRNGFRYVRPDSTARADPDSKFPDPRRVVANLRGEWGMDWRPKKPERYYGPYNRMVPSETGQVILMMLLMLPLLPLFLFMLLIMVFGRLGNTEVVTEMARANVWRNTWRR